jgi:ribonuclease D
MSIFVEKPAQLASLADDLGHDSLYCLDTEFDSRASRVTLCLIQLVANDEIYIIDTLALRDLQPLTEHLGNPNCTWIFHGGHQDVPLLRRALGLSQLPRLFDTQIVWGLSSPEPATSFAYLNYRLLGIRGSKQHQTDDWMRRPLTHSQIDYAAHDVETLPRLYQLLSQRVTDLGRHRQATDACQEILGGAQACWEPLTLESYRNAWQLQPAGQRALSDLIDWYNALTPHDRDSAPESKLLWSMANRLPKSVEALHQVRGLPRTLTPAHQQRILSIMREAERSGSRQPALLEPPPYATYERLQLDAWLEYVRCAACAKAQVSKELVLGGHRLRRLKDSVAKLGLDAFQPETLAEILGNWQFELLGDALVWASKRIEPPTALT